VSRLALSKELDLAPSTIGIYVERLLEEGFLCEEKQQKPQKSGRPEVFLKLNPARGFFVGVDFYAEHIMALSVDFANQSVKQEVILLDSSDDEKCILKKIVKVIHDVHLPDQELLGLGVSIPGTIDQESGTLIKYKWLPNIANLAIGAELQRHFLVPVTFENTANLMALGEMKFGRNRDLQNFINMTIRSGIGCGVIINGQIVSGENNLCGEVEYWRCPSVGSGDALPELGELCSSSGIVQKVKDELEKGAVSTLGAKTTIEKVIEAYGEGDSLAEKIIGESILTLSWALTQISLMLAPKKIILSGDLTALNSLWLEPILLQVGELYKRLPMEPPTIELSTLGKNSAALGAASMAIQNWRLSRD
jgi:predicted NBD/HSP70 family sugar kinase